MQPPPFFLTAWLHTACNAACWHHFLWVCFPGTRWSDNCASLWSFTLTVRDRQKTETCFKVHFRIFLAASLCLDWRGRPTHLHHKLDLAHVSVAPGTRFSSSLLASPDASWREERNRDAAVFLLIILRNIRSAEFTCSHAGRRANTTQQCSS